MKKRTDSFVQLEILAREGRIMSNEVPSSIRELTTPTPIITPTRIPTTQPPVATTHVQPFPGCAGTRYDNVCILDPSHLLTAQPAESNAIIPMSNDMATSLFYGTVLVSQNDGALQLSIIGPNDINSCKTQIFMAFGVTEHDYLFPRTTITCKFDTTALTATLTAKTAKKIDWDTQLDASSESLIAWEQYDVHTP